MAIKNVFPGAHVFEHGNYGYPFRGSPRRRKPRIHGVTHITGNSSLASALAEIKYSARVGSGASFPFAVNRNGSVAQGFDPILFAPWTNGDVNKPDLSSPIIAAIVRSGVNFNEECLVTIENVGFGSAHPMNDTQIETNAQIYAWAAKLVGATSISVQVVIGHRQVNSVSRWNCPTPGNLLALRKKIVDRANAILRPAPAPQEDESMPPRMFVPQSWKTNKDAKVYLSPSTSSEVIAVIEKGVSVASIEEEAEIIDGKRVTNGPMRTVVLADLRTGFMHRNDIDPVPGGPPEYTAFIQAALLGIDLDDVPTWPITPDRELIRVAAQGAADAVRDVGVKALNDAADEFGP